VDRAIDSLKAYKAKDEGGLVAEMLKGAGVDSILREELFTLLSFVWKSGVCPSAWNSAVIVPLFKKGDLSVMNNYRGIALQDIVEKVFVTIILKRLEPIVEPQIYEGQYGFRRNRSTIDAIYNIRKVIESSREFNKPLYISFIDITKAYDSVSRPLLWEALRDHNVPEYLITLIKTIYFNTSARVRVGDSLSDKFSLGIGVKQGDILSPLLFNIFLNFVWKKITKKWNDMGILFQYGGGGGGGGGVYFWLMVSVIGVKKILVFLKNYLLFNPYCMPTMPLY